MADFDEILSADNIYGRLLACIDLESPLSVREEMHQLREEDATITLAPALIHCIDVGKHEMLENLLSEGVEIEESVVEYAAYHENPTYLDILLRRGWRINRSMRNGKLPSVLCFASNDQVLLEKLLSRGADPNATSTAGETPLTVAVREASRTVVQRLLSAGGDVNKGDLLHAAVERNEGNIEMIDLLVSNGADVNSIEYQHPSALMLRSQLLCGTPLHKACFRDHLGAIDALLRHGGDPYSTRQKYQETEATTPLDVAKAKGNVEIVRLFQKWVPQISEESA